MSKTKIVREKIWGRLKDVAHRRFALSPELRRGDPRFRRLGEGHRPPGRPSPSTKPASMPSSRRTIAWSISAGACCSPARRWWSRPTASIAAFACSSRRWFRRARSFSLPGSTGSSISASRSRSPRWRRAGRFDFMVTGASAVSLDGVRFGKGHGFFDLEWGMFTDVGIVDEATPVAARRSTTFRWSRTSSFPSPTDILVDVIATPTRLIHVERRAAAPARHQVGPARSRSRSPTRRRSRNCRKYEGRRPPDGRASHRRTTGEI